MLNRVDQAVLLSAADLSLQSLIGLLGFSTAAKAAAALLWSWVSGVLLVVCVVNRRDAWSTKLFRRPCRLSFTELLASLSTSVWGSDFVGLRLSQCIQHGLVLGRVDQAVLLSVADLSLQSLIGLLGFLNRGQGGSGVALVLGVSGVLLLSASLIAGMLGSTKLFRRPCRLSFTELLASLSTSVWAATLSACA